MEKRFVLHVHLSGRGGHARHDFDEKQVLDTNGRVLRMQSLSMGIGLLRRGCNDPVKTAGIKLSYIAGTRVFCADEIPYAERPVDNITLGFTVIDYIMSRYIHGKHICVRVRPSCPYSKDLRIIKETFPMRFRVEKSAPPHCMRLILYSAL